jgi:phosphoribosyl-AMP cyclohydrolase
MPSTRFAPRGSAKQLEEGRVFAPKFDADGLIRAIVADGWSGEVLMLAYMNEQALANSIETGEAWFYSLSRNALWRKGEKSGNTLRIFEIRVNCEQDGLLIKVEQKTKGICHTGRASCFYRTLGLREPAGRMLLLTPRDADKVFDPSELYSASEKTGYGDGPQAECRACAEDAA